MKKIVTTLTALAFALSLTAAGYAQTTVKPGDKPAVKTESTAPAATATPAQQDKSKEAVKPVAKTNDKGKDKGKKEEKQVTSQEKEKKPVTSPESKKEEKSEVKK
jgi:hypothetical protein